MEVRSESSHGADHCCSRSSLHSWLTFWKMVRHALFVATQQQCPTNDILWSPPPPELMPHVTFIKERVHACYDRFTKRSQREAELVPTLSEVLTEVQTLLQKPI